MYLRQVKPKDGGKDFPGRNDPEADTMNFAPKQFSERVGPGLRLLRTTLLYKKINIKN